MISLSSQTNVRMYHGAGALVAGLGAWCILANPHVAGLLALVLLALLISLVAPMWALYLYSATLFLFQLEILGGSTIAIPTVTAVLFLSATGLFLFFHREQIYLRSSLPLTSAFFGVAILVSAISTPGWFLQHPRGAATMWGLIVTSLAVAVILRKGQGFGVIVWIVAGGCFINSALSVYETITGNFNTVGAFTSYDERAYGLSDPNYTAAMLVTFLPFLLVICLSAGKAWKQFVGVGLVALSLLAIVMTESRGGVFGVAVVSAASILWLRIPSSVRDVQRKQTTRLGNTAAVLLLLICTGVAAKFVPDTFYQRLSNPQNWTNPHKESRLQLWDYYLQKISDAPLWGSGPGYLDPTFVEGRENSAHNTIIEFLLEIGVVGTAFYLIMTYCAIREVLIARRKFLAQGEVQFALLSAAVAVAIVGFNFTALFLTAGTHKEIWLLIGMTAALGDLSCHPAGRILKSGDLVQPVDVVAAGHAN